MIFFITVNNDMPHVWQLSYAYLSPFVVLIATLVFCVTLRKLHII